MPQNFFWLMQLHTVSPQRHRISMEQEDWEIVEQRAGGGDGEKDGADLDAVDMEGVRSRTP
eukprot:44449-Eustigmatos_ZCMA.PRE.1